MRMRWSGIVTLAFLALTPSLGEAQATLGPTLAYHDGFDFGIGATLRTPRTGFGEGVGLMVDFIYFFPEGTGLSAWELNGNVTYDFPLQESTVLPFVLGGLNLAHGSGPGGGNTELGLNVGGGIEFDLGTFRPVAGGRFEISGGEGFVIFITLPFALNN